MEPTSQAYAEKRQSPRVTEQSKYTLILDEKQHQGELGNISLGGAYLRTISPLITESSLYQSCQLMLHLPHADLSLSCTIAFVGVGHNEQSIGVGLAFVLDQDEALAAIAEHIENTL